MKSSWLVVMSICVLGCACGRTPAEGTAVGAGATPVEEVPPSSPVPASPLPSPEALLSPTVQAMSPLPSPEVPPSTGVAIYLTTEEVTPVDLVPGTGSGSETTPPSPDKLPLQASPLITQDDIVAYEAASHAFVLTPEAMERVTGAPFALAGPPFVMTVDGEAIYAGAFWSLLSSQSFDGVVIMVMPGGAPAVVGESVPEGEVCQIRLGYPGSDFFHGEDPRDDPRIFEALDAAGKLK